MNAFADYRFAQEYSQFQMQAAMAYAVLEIAEAVGAANGKTHAAALISSA